MAPNRRTELPIGSFQCGNFISPPPPPMAMWPYGPPVFNNDMAFELGSHSGSLGQIPMFPTFYPTPDPHLPSKIVRQIDYYFSDDNLAKDIFLRQKMDRDGWVPINLIATFQKMRELTDNIQLILEALRSSNVVEVQGEKVRRKGNWKKWMLPPAMYPTWNKSTLTWTNMSHELMLDISRECTSRELR